MWMRKKMRGKIKRIKEDADRRLKDAKTAQVKTDEISESAIEIASRSDDLAKANRIAAAMAIAFTPKPNGK